MFISYIFRADSDKYNITNRIPLIYLWAPQRNRDKRTTAAAFLVSFLDNYLIFHINGQIYTRLYDKRDDFSFAIKEMHTLIVIYWSTAPVCGVNISQLISCARDCSMYSDFLLHLRLRTKLLNKTLPDHFLIHDLSPGL